MPREKMPKWGVEVAPDEEVGEYSPETLRLIHDRGMDLSAVVREGLKIEETL